MRQEHSIVCFLGLDNFNFSLTSGKAHFDVIIRLRSFERLKPWFMKKNSTHLVANTTHMLELKDEFNAIAFHKSCSCTQM